MPYLRRNVPHLIDSAFRIKRPAFHTAGLLAPVDPYVKMQIKNLAKALSKKSIKELELGADLSNLLEMDLKLLIETLSGPTRSGNQYTFSDIVQKFNAGLYLELTDLIDTKKLSYNTNALLSEKSILTYLFCKAVYGLKLDTSDDAATAIFNYISKDTETGGIRLFYDYIALEATWAMILDKKIEVGVNETDFKENKLRQKLNETNINFSEDAFTPFVTAIVNDLIYSEEEYAIINDVRDRLNIEDEDIPALVSYMQQSKFQIDKDNAAYYLAIALNDIKNTGISYTSSTSPEIKDIDFSVKFYEDEKGTLEFARENVACAAQMYYVMTLGDELEIFNVINRIVTHYMPSGFVDIRSKETLRDLQSYVFNDGFKDQNHIVYNRTHPEERKMFYKQLFNLGDGETVEGMVVNEDFNALWERLFVESVKYIDKVERSINPTEFVSNQNICQTVEDLQYNLSTHCSGMTKVVSPIINKELDFIIERFLKNDELIKQLALNNSKSFWKVIERVLTDLRHEVPNVSALRDKAVLGYKIISTIADYTQGYFDDDKNFGEFISTVEAYIIANKAIEKRRDVAMPGIVDSYPREPPSISEEAPGEEWNF